MIELEVPGKAFNEFIQTKEYKKFKEFADSVVEYRYIGICHGEAGVGKSLAASYYSNWDEKIAYEDGVSSITEEIKNKISTCKAVFITTPVYNSPKAIHDKIVRRVNGFGRAYYKSLGKTDLDEILIDSERS